MIILLEQQPHVFTTIAIQLGTTIFNPQRNTELTYTICVIFPMPLGCSLSAPIGTDPYLLVLRIVFKTVTVDSEGEKRTRRTSTSHIACF